MHLNTLATICVKSGLFSMFYCICGGRLRLLIPLTFTCIYVMFANILNVALHKKLFIVEIRGTVSYRYHKIIDEFQLPI